MTDTQKRDYTVQGMTCQHCISSVREEVEEIAGVEAVDVDLVTGRLTVEGAAFGDDDVRTAVREAGYDVVT